MNEYITPVATTLFYVIIIAILYIVVAIPQKKARKDLSTMQQELKLGDTVTTHSGIIGKIIEINEDVITISTGPDEIKLNVQRWSVVSKN